MNLQAIHLWHAQLAGQTLAWFGEDTEQNFKKNLSDPDRRPLLEASGWLDRDIEYRFNSLGFRGNEPRSDINNFCVFGDSVSFGSSMPEDLLYVYHISQATGLWCNNFGAPGGSDSTSFRLALTWLEQMNPKFAIYQKTFEHRLEWIERETEAIGYGAVALAGGNPPVSDDAFYRHWIDSEANRKLMSIKNEMAMKWLCDQVGIPVIVTDIEQFITGEDDKARDLLHPGPTRHREIADRLLEKIQDIL